MSPDEKILNDNKLAAAVCCLTAGVSCSLHLTGAQIKNPFLFIDLYVFQVKWTSNRPVRLLLNKDIQDQVKRF